MRFTLIPHYFIFPPSVRLSVSRLAFPNHPMILRAFRGDRFRFLPEPFSVSSRHFCHELSIVKGSATLHAPHGSVVVAFIRLVQGQRASAPAVYQLCLDLDVALPILNTVRAYLGHSKLGVAVNRPVPNIGRSLGVAVAPDGSPNASSTSYPIRGKNICCRSPDVRRDPEKMRTPASGGYPCDGGQWPDGGPNHSAMAADVRPMGGINREPKVAPAAVGRVDAASEPDGNPDVDPIVTGWRASGGVETGPDRRNSASMLRSAGTSTSASAR
jgi:hypothetical protein